MKEYELVTEYINPCGGAEYAIREIFENIELTSDNADTPVYVHNK